MLHLLVEGRELHIYDTFAVCTQKTPPGTIVPEGLREEVLSFRDVHSRQSPHVNPDQHQKRARVTLRGPTYMTDWDMSIGTDGPTAKAAFSSKFVLASSSRATRAVRSRGSAYLFALLLSGSR